MVYPPAMATGDHYTRGDYRPEKPIKTQLQT